LPDSAIDLLDEAGAMVRMQAAPGRPEPVEGRAVVEAPPPLPVDVAEIEQVVARIANIPARQASSSDKDRLRTLEESLGRVGLGQHEAVSIVACPVDYSENARLIERLGALTESI